MATFTVSPVAATANIEKDSASRALASNITSAVIQLTDSAGSTTPAANSNWKHTSGNVTIWGVQFSADGGVTWSWLAAGGNFAFGTLQRDGVSMPAVAISGDQLAAVAGNLVRLAIKTDANITLGAIITVN